MSLTIVRSQGLKGKSDYLRNRARDFLVKPPADVESCPRIHADILYSCLMFVASWHFAATVQDDIVVSCYRQA